MFVLCTRVPLLLSLVELVRGGFSDPSASRDERQAFFPPRSSPRSRGSGGRTWAPASENIRRARPTEFDVSSSVTTGGTDSVTTGGTEYDLRLTTSLTAASCCTTPSSLVERDSFARKMLSSGRSSYFSASGARGSERSSGRRSCPVMEGANPVSKQETIIPPASLSARCLSPRETRSSSGGPGRGPHRPDGSSRFNEARKRIGAANRRGSVDDLDLSTTHSKHLTVPDVGSGPALFSRKKRKSVSLPSDLFTGREDTMVSGIRKSLVGVMESPEDEDEGQPKDPDEEVGRGTGSSEFYPPPILFLSAHHGKG